MDALPKAARRRTPPAPRRRRALRALFDWWWSIGQARQRLRRLDEAYVVDAMARQLEEIRRLPEVTA